MITEAAVKTRQHEDGVNDGSDTKRGKKIKRLRASSDKEKQVKSNEKRLEEKIESGTGMPTIENSVITKIIKCYRYLSIRC